MRRRRKKRQRKSTFSKMWMNRLLWFCCLWITFSYLLAYMGYVEIAQALSQTACATIIGTMIPYFAKSYLETYAEKNLEFEKEKYYNQNITDVDNVDDNVDAVG